MRDLQRHGVIQLYSPTEIWLLSGVVKKTESSTNLEKNTVTVAYCANTEEFSRRSTKDFSGQRISFSELVHFDKYLTYNAKK